jgi:hypothetical protein
VKFDLQTIFGIAGIGLTVLFGVWSIVAGKVKAGSRFVKLFLVFVLVYAGQLLGTKWLGKPLLPDATFGTLVSVMLVWMMIATMRDAE